MSCLQCIYYYLYYYITSLISYQISPYICTRSQNEDSINGRNKNYTSHRTVSVNPSVIKQHLSKPEATAMSKAVVDLPLSKDAIEAITTFCFPGINIYFYCNNIFKFKLKCKDFV